MKNLSKFKSALAVSLLLSGSAFSMDVLSKALDDAERKGCGKATYAEVARGGTSGSKGGISGSTLHAVESGYNNQNVNPVKGFTEAQAKQIFKRATFNNFTDKSSNAGIILQNEQDKVAFLVDPKGELTIIVQGGDEALHQRLNGKQKNFNNLSENLFGQTEELAASRAEFLVNHVYGNLARFHQDKMNNQENLSTDYLLRAFSTHAAYTDADQKRAAQLKVIEKSNFEANKVALTGFLRKLCGNTVDSDAIVSQEQRVKTAQKRLVKQALGSYDSEIAHFVNRVRPKKCEKVTLEFLDGKFKLEETRALAEKVIALKEDQNAEYMQGEAQKFIQEYHTYTRLKVAKTTNIETAELLTRQGKSKFDAEVSAKAEGVLSKDVKELRYSKNERVKELAHLEYYNQLTQEGKKRDNAYCGSEVAQRDRYVRDGVDMYGKELEHTGGMAHFNQVMYTNKIDKYRESNKQLKQFMFDHIVSTEKLAPTAQQMMRNIPGTDRINLMAGIQNSIECIKSRLAALDNKVTASECHERKEDAKVVAAVKKVSENKESSAQTLAKALLSAFTADKK